MKFLRIALAGWLLALLPTATHGSITITSSSIGVLTNTRFGTLSVADFYGTDIPTSTTLDVTPGIDLHSRNTIDWSTNGGQTILSFDLNQQRMGTNSAVALTSGSVNFTASSSDIYVLSGDYSVSDAGGTSGYVYQNAYLLDLTVFSYLVNIQNVSEGTHNEQFQLGSIGGDQPSSFINGNLTGNLIAGHSYEFYFSARIQAPRNDDSGASALGNFTLTIGEAAAGVVPEPLSALVWVGLIAVSIVRRVRPGN